MMDFLYSIYHFAEKILNSFHRERPKTLGEELDSHYEQDDFSPVANPNFGYQPKTNRTDPSNPPTTGSNLVRDVNLVVKRFVVNGEPMSMMPLGESHDILYYKGSLQVIKMNNDISLFNCACCGKPHKASDMYLFENKNEPNFCALVCDGCVTSSGKTFSELYAIYKKPRTHVLIPCSEPVESDVKDEDVISFKAMNTHQKTLFYKCHCCGIDNPDSELQLIRNETRNTYAVICKKCLVDHLKDMKEWIAEYGKNWDEEPLRPVEEEKPHLTPLEKLQLRRQMRDNRNARKRELYAKKKQEE